MTPDWLAIKLLEGDDFATAHADTGLRRAVQHARTEIEQALGGRWESVFPGRSRVAETDLCRDRQS